ncbi:alpha/beta fold hydrolase [Nocardia panacis]|uniref:Alpha/beta fold hydrolase n=1 Tax=Nocardia panacis TaxID=2340916 RepID=A0A3A4KZA2_9NOCA|nr:alpha/beta fold hydrolase [Nocardia panacis]RJO79284.1 alpha/beta fold hydrolase [Nocardia panacis]
MSYAKAADGVRIAYQSAGAGAPLILLAGQANNHHWWDDIRTDFHGTHRTITMDWRGAGDSDKPDRACTTVDFADDVIAVLDDLGIERADVYGTSMGGRVAQWVAARHPERVGALILGCTSPGDAHGVPRAPEVRRSLAQPDRVAARRALKELMYTPAWLATHTGPLQTLGDPTMPPYAQRRHRIASAQHDAWDALPHIRSRTLVLHGGDDIFNPAANAPLLAERIPGAELRVIPGARHAYFDEFRTLASPLALEFLTA